MARHFILCRKERLHLLVRVVVCLMDSITLFSTHVLAVGPRLHLLPLFSGKDSMLAGRLSRCRLWPTLRTRLPLIKDMLILVEFLKFLSLSMVR